MGNEKNNVVMFFIVLVFLMVGLFYILPLDKNTETTRYCKIDWVYKTSPSNKYHTKCGQLFYSKKDYVLGDSIKIKTIILDK